jgi:succinate dehydrogenase / fumarate reductase membrane anchor subunit
MGYRTDRQRVEGLGPAKSGSGHWWTQRLTAVALMMLTPLFILPFAHNLGTGWEHVRASYGHPFNAIVAILFIIVMFTHLQKGLQVVIEDYVHSKCVLVPALLANTFFCWVFGLTGVFAVAKIAFAA